MNSSELNEKLNRLLERQSEFIKEIEFLRTEIEHLKSQEVKKPPTTTIPPFPESTKSQRYVDRQPKHKATTAQPIKENVQKPKKEQKKKASVVSEKLIAGNIMNKIGILITIIGVFIGVKYTIDNNLISPVARIVLAYLFAFGLLAVAFKLKKTYNNFSAVILSGAMTMLYFITFIAFDFYNLIPRVLAFLIMLIFTVFTVLSAQAYKKQIIAILGLVGAYAIPFLLSSGSGAVEILFSYMLLINMGIIFVSIKNRWPKLFYISFSATWLIFTSWYSNRFDVNEYFLIAILFSTAFYFQFYVISLARKVMIKEPFEKLDLLFSYLNSFIFYGIIYSVLNQGSRSDSFIGIATVLIAGTQVLAAYYHKKFNADPAIRHLTIALAFIFLALAIPVQFNGKWMTIFWVLEAAVLFIYGRKTNIAPLETLGVIIMHIGIISLVVDWAAFYMVKDTGERTLLNTMFLSSLFSFSAVVYSYKYHIQKASIFKTLMYLPYLNSFFPTAGIGILYFMFNLEISAFWSNTFANNTVVLDEQIYYNRDYHSFSSLSIAIYTTLFTGALLHIIKLKKKIRLNLALYISVVGVLIICLLTNLQLSSLRYSYLHDNNDMFIHGIMNLLVRYIFYSAVLYFFYAFRRTTIPLASKSALVHYSSQLAILFFLSTELYVWVDVTGIAGYSNMLLSILWGCYGLFIATRGIFKSTRELRLFGIVLLGITILKLFLVDLTKLSTIEKTAVFISLGLLMLLLSFLYNKFKPTEELETNEN